MAAGSFFGRDFQPNDDDGSEQGQAEKKLRGIEAKFYLAEARALPPIIARFSKPFWVAMVLPSLSLCDSACKAALRGIKNRPAAKPVTISIDVDKAAG